MFLRAIVIECRKMLNCELNVKVSTLRIFDVHFGERQKYCLHTLVVVLQIFTVLIFASAVGLYVVSLCLSVYQRPVLSQMV